MTLSRKQEGFTIVELLIVIIVIGILATLVLVTFTGIQQSARNTQRVTDIKAVASHLETYNAKNGYYPTESDMNDTADGGFVKTELKGLDIESLRDPKGTLYTFIAGDASSSQYGYKPLPDNCDNDPAGVGDCTSFTLSWKAEGDNAVNKQENL